MKPLPPEDRTRGRLGPGVLCAEGFLGDDRRDLGEILEADQSAVQRLGVTHEQVAMKLLKALQAAEAGMGLAVRVGDVTAVWHEAMGMIPCPFGDGMFPKGEVELTGARTSQTLRVTRLSIHLISHHGFYQGLGGRYRVDPETACRLFDLPRRH